MRRDGHGRVVSGAERDALVIGSEEPLVGNGDTVSVAAKVGDHVGRSAEGRLDVDDPFGLAGQAREESPPGDCVGSARTILGEGDGPLFAKLGETLEHELAEEGLHAGGGEEEFLALDPPGAVEAETAGGDHAVEVGVVEELAGPGVKDGGDSELGAEGLLGEEGEGGSGRGEEEGVELPGMAQPERSELGGKCEDDMVVSDGEDALGAGFDPPGLGEGLAVRAVAIPAGVVVGLLVAAVRADVEVAAEGGGPAAFHVAEEPVLLGGEGVLLPVGIPVAAEDLHHLGSVGRSSPLPGAGADPGAAFHGSLRQVQRCRMEREARRSGSVLR
jgi:hypothetical protein